MTLTARWNDAKEQLRSHAPCCTCDPCLTARGFLERMAQLIAEVFGD